MLASLGTISGVANQAFSKTLSDLTSQKEALYQCQNRARFERLMPDTTAFQRDIKRLTAELFAHLTTAKLDPEQITGQNLKDIAQLDVSVFDAFITQAGMTEVISRYAIDFFLAAVRHRNAALVTRLLAQNADGTNVFQSIIDALTADSLDCFELLKEAENTPETFLQLLAETEDGHFRFPKLIPYLPQDEVYLLYSAAYHNRMPNIRALLRLKSDGITPQFPEVLKNIANYNNRFILWAACNGSIDAVEEFLAYPQVVQNLAANNNIIIREVASSLRAEQSPRNLWLRC